MKITINIDRKRVFAALAVTSVIGLAACDTTPTVAQTEQSQSNQGAGALLKNQPVPYWPTSEGRKTLTLAEDEQAHSLATTSFVMKQGNLDPIKVCVSHGFPVPVTAQLTNPQQIAGDTYHSLVTIGNMDPLGYYVPPSSAGTWIDCVAPDGTQKITYAEDDVLTEPGVATWDYVKHQVVPDPKDTAFTPHANGQ